MFLVAPAVLGAIPGVLSGVAGVFGQSQANKANAREAAKNRAFQERMRNTAWQAGVEDMRAAGLNPALAYSSGPASSPGGSLAAKQEDSLAVGLSSARSAMEARKNMRILDAQLRKLDADAKISEAAATDAERTNTTKWGIETILPDGSRGTIGATMLLSEMLQRMYGADQARNLASISSSGAGVSSAINPALRSLSGLAGQGYSNLASQLERVPGLTQGAFRDIMTAWRRRQNSRIRR